MDRIDYLESQDDECIPGSSNTNHVDACIQGTVRSCFMQDGDTTVSLALLPRYIPLNPPPSPQHPSLSLALALTRLKYIIQMKGICHFFQQGRCRNGSYCKFEHVPAAAPSTQYTGMAGLSASAPSFVPSNSSSSNQPTPPSYPTNASSSSSYQIPVCKYFQWNACNRGSACRYLHVLEGANANGSEAKPPSSLTKTSKLALDGTTKMEKPFGTTKEATVSKNSNRVALSGAEVLFSEGAAVSSISLPSDFSTISITNIPSSVSKDDVCSMIRHYGFENITPAAITLHSESAGTPQSAKVKIADPTFATRFLERTGPEFDFGGSKVLASLVTLGGDSAAGANRLQLTVVSCTWHEPSTIIYLKYSNAFEANKILRAASKRAVNMHGRQLSFKQQESSTRTIVVSNVSTNTEGESLIRELPDYISPQKITQGPNSHFMQPEEIEKCVRTSMEKCGTMQQWIVTPLPGSSKVKAKGTFISIESARRAVSELDNTTIDLASKIKLRVQPQVSIKLSVSQRVRGALKTKLCRFITDAEKSHVFVKIYDNPNKNHTQIRVSGQKKESVAEIKASLEMLLLGHVFHLDNTPSTRQVFFPVGPNQYLEAVMKTNNVYIVSDETKLALRIYGDDDQQIRATEEILAKRLETLKEQSKSITLEGNLLQIALKGGFKHLVELFGKDDVKMDVISNPKRITVLGSERRAQEVEKSLRAFSHTRLLNDMSNLTLDESQRKNLCPVCYTHPEEPFTTKCGHTYCTDCLSFQCSSATAFPITCLGASAKCAQPLALQDIKDIITPSNYDTLLQTSFAAYIRAHSTVFQYCPTPDCDRCYRTSASPHADDPRIFTCDGCLASVCTGCNRPMHDGLSCAENKDGYGLLEKWKEENDVRDCPHCKAPIEKEYGCQHMHCTACDTHICWFCMQTFGNSGDTYRHMRDRHGEIYG